jgi:hypothetical protein
MSSITEDVSLMVEQDFDKSEISIALQDCYSQEEIKTWANKENLNDDLVTELESLFKICIISKSMPETEELAKVQKYADILKEVIDWKRLARIIKATGSSLNGPKERFDKSDILEQAVCEYSTEKGRFIWEDKVGYDILDKATGSKIELKYVENALIKKVGKEIEL